MLPCRAAKIAMGSSESLMQHQYIRVDADQQEKSVEWPGKGTKAGFFSPEPPRYG